MILEKLLIFNFRSCQNMTFELSHDSPNILIGLNDSGKSTILQSLNLLFNDKGKFNATAEGSYRSDLSNSPITGDEINENLEKNSLPSMEIEEGTTVIVGVLAYDSEEEGIHSEVNLSPGLQWALESQTERTLVLARKYNGTDSGLFVVSKDSDESQLKLWDQNQTAINKYIDELNVTPDDIKNENGKGRFSTFEKIRAVYGKLNCSLQWSEYKFAKDDKSIIPEFSLFDWNTSLEEITLTANSIMKELIEEHLSPVKTFAATEAGKAEKEVNKKFGDLSEVLRSVAKDVEGISSKVHFEVKERISDIMIQKARSDGDIHLENQGDGLKRQIWFSLIKAKASTEKEGSNKFIWAFDEPETHLFPGAQRDFFDILIQLSEGDVQTVVSTHSTIFTDKSMLPNIRITKQNDDGYTEVNEKTDVTTIFSSLGMKNSDFLFYDKFLVVEGDTEQYLIPALYELKYGRSLLNDNIQLINLRGKDKWQGNKDIIDKVLGEIKRSDDQVIFLFDNDMRFEIGAEAVTESMHFVGRQDIEDSIGSQLWAEALNIFYEGHLTFTEPEVEEWLGQVPQNVKCQNHEKFYAVIKRGVRDKWTEAGNSIDDLLRLPEKGVDSASLLRSMFKSAEDIPEEIHSAFESLNTVE